MVRCSCLKNIGIIWGTFFMPMCGMFSPGNFDGVEFSDTRLVLEKIMEDDNAFKQYKEFVLTNFPDFKKKIEEKDDDTFFSVLILSFPTENFTKNIVEKLINYCIQKQLFRTLYSFLKELDRKILVSVVHTILEKDEDNPEFIKKLEDLMLACIWTSPSFVTDEKILPWISKISQSHQTSYFERFCKIVVDDPSAFARVINYMRCHKEVFNKELLAVCLNNAVVKEKNGRLTRFFLLLGAYVKNNYDEQVMLKIQGQEIKMLLESFAQYQKFCEKDDSVVLPTVVTFIWALQMDNLALVKKLLTENMVLEFKEKTGFTPLTYAVINNALRVVRYLLELLPVEKEDLLKFYLPDKKILQNGVSFLKERLFLSIFAFVENSKNKNNNDDESSDKQKDASKYKDELKGESIFTNNSFFIQCGKRESISSTRSNYRDFLALIGNNENIFLLAKIVRAVRVGRVILRQLLLKHILQEGIKKYDTISHKISNKMANKEAVVNTIVGYVNLQ